MSAGSHSRIEFRCCSDHREQGSYPGSALYLGQGEGEATYTRARGVRVVHPPAMQDRVQTRVIFVPYALQGLVG